MNSDSLVEQFLINIQQPKFKSLFHQIWVNLAHVRREAWAQHKLICISYRSIIIKYQVYTCKTNLKVSVGIWNGFKCSRFFVNMPSSLINTSSIIGESNKAFVTNTSLSSPEYVKRLKIQITSQCVCLCVCVPETVYVCVCVFRC